MVYFGVLLYDLSYLYKEPECNKGTKVAHDWQDDGLDATEGLEEGTEGDVVYCIFLLCKVKFYIHCQGLEFLVLVEFIVRVDWYQSIEVPVSTFQIREVLEYKGLEFIWEETQDPARDIRIDMHLDGWSDADAYSRGLALAEEKRLSFEEDGCGGII